MSDWLHWLTAATALGFTAWGGWIAHRQRWWMGNAFLVAWYVGAAIVVAGLAYLLTVTDA